MPGVFRKGDRCDETDPRPNHNDRLSLPTQPPSVGRALRISVERSSDPSPLYYRLAQCSQWAQQRILTRFLFGAVSTVLWALKMLNWSLANKEPLSPAILEF